MIAPQSVLTLLRYFAGAPVLRTSRFYPLLALILSVLPALPQRKQLIFKTKKALRLECL